MPQHAPYRIGETFSPIIELKKYYFLIFSIVAIPAIFFCLGAVALFQGMGGIVISVPIFGILIFVLYWIPLFYGTIRYELTRTEITWRRGVWFRQTGIVPYSRITNIDIMQGPVMRIFGISSLKIQTAGYSAQPHAELQLNGIAEPEELRELIMGFVRSGAGIASESGGDGTAGPASDPVVDELRQIRAILGRIEEKR